VWRRTGSNGEQKGVILSEAKDPFAAEESLNSSAGEQGSFFASLLRMTNKTLEVST
jgi:hypothetical protein